MKLKALSAVVAILLAAKCGLAQTAGSIAQTDNKHLAFEVVSIRQNTGPGNRQLEVTPTGSRLTNMSMLTVVITAYVPSSGAGLFAPNNVLGVPDWMRQQRFDIEAKVSESDLPEWQKPSQQPAMVRAMLQSMLAERLKLAVHRETKEESVYSLVVAKNGPKLKESVPGEPHPAGRNLPGNGGVMGPEGSDRMVHFYGINMPTFAALLSDLGGRPVLDDTGLTSRYDFAIQHPANTNVSSPQPASGGSDPGPTIFSALSELGLKLVSAKRPMEILVIDHAEPPSEN